MIYFQLIMKRINKTKNRWTHIRQNWNLHVAQLVHEGYFKNKYIECHLMHGIDYMQSYHPN